MSWLSRIGSGTGLATLFGASLYGGILLADSTEPDFSLCSCQCTYCPSESSVLPANHARLLSAKAPVPSNLHLQSVYLLFRHGARTPYVVLPEIIDFKFDWSPMETGLLASTNEVPFTFTESDTLEASQDSYLPGGASIGQLTTSGQADLINKGAGWRLDYVDWLSGLSDEDVLLRTRNNRRCLLSLLSVLSGLYGDECRKKSFNVVMKDGVHDELLPLIMKDELLSSKMKWLSLEWSKHQPRVQDILSHYILPSRNPDTEIDHACSLSHIRLVDVYDNVVCAAFAAISNPANVVMCSDKDLQNAAVNDEMCRLATKEILLHYFGPYTAWKRSISCSIGPLLNSLIKSMTEQSKYPRLQLWSTQDIIILPLLISLGWKKEDLRLPPFAASLVIELYSDSNFYNDRNPRICRVLYNNVPVLLPNTQSEFVTVDTLISQWNQYCMDPQLLPDEVGHLSADITNYLIQHSHQQLMSLCIS